MLNVNERAPDARCHTRAVLVPILSPPSAQAAGSIIWSGCLTRVFGGSQFVEACRSYLVRLPPGMCLVCGFWGTEHRSLIILAETCVAVTKANSAFENQ